MTEPSVAPPEQGDAVPVSEPTSLESLPPEPAPLEPADPQAAPVAAAGATPAPSTTEAVENEEPPVASRQVSDGGAEDGGDAPADTQDIAPGRASWLTVGLVGLLAALLAAATVLLAVRFQDGRATDQARTDGGRVSRDAARALLSYDYRSLDKDFAAGRSFTTGAFRKKFQSVTSDVVKNVATQTQAVVKADVIESSVVEASPNEVTALLFVNSTATSNQQMANGPNIVQSRVKMHLVKTDGRWLVDQVAAL